MLGCKTLKRMKRSDRAIDYFLPYPMWANCILQRQAPNPHSNIATGNTRKLMKLNTIATGSSC